MKKPEPAFWSVIRRPDAHLDLQRSVDLASVPDMVNDDCTNFGFYLVNDTIVTDSEPIKPIGIHQLDAWRPKGILRQPLNAFQDPQKSLLGNFAKIFPSSRLEL